MKLVFYVALFTLFVTFLPVHAEARIDILPRKILLEDRVRSDEVTLLNLGNKTQIIRVTLISYRQKPDGTYEVLENVPLNPAFDPNDVVRISPKQFTLPPQGRQKVRFTVQRPAGIPDGEYRFHIRAVSYETEESAEGRPAPVKGSGVFLKTNLGVAIPVVVRKGNLVSTGKIENVSLLSERQTQSGKPALKFDLSRTGTASILGTLRVMWEDGKNPPRQIGIISNLNVFEELSKRTTVLELEEMPQGSGKIRLILTNEFGDKGVIDEVVLTK